MPLSDVSLVLNIILVLLLVCFIQRQLRGLLKHLWKVWQQHRPHRWQPQSPCECPQCQAGVKLQVVRSKGEIRPYQECKSRRGRKKAVSTGGFACPQVQCAYHGVTDASLYRRSTSAVLAT